MVVNGNETGRGQEKASKGASRVLERRSSEGERGPGVLALSGMLLKED